MRLRMQHVLVFSVAILVSNASLCYTIEDMGLEAKAKKSDLVFIGTVQQTNCCHENFFGASKDSGVALVLPTSVLKGSAPPKVKFRYWMGMPEWRVDCCEIGKSYLFFAVKEESGTYHTVNKRFGVYAMEPALINEAK
jgi:hypothetical protein